MGLLRSGDGIPAICPGLADGKPFQLFIHTQGNRELWQHQEARELILRVLTFASWRLHGESVPAQRRQDEKAERHIKKTMPAEIVTAHLSAGSNLGKRQTNLNQAISALGEGGAIPKRISSIFETEPLGFPDQPWFLNIAIEVETSLSPRALLELCRKTEDALGRVRTFQNAPRILDLDILLYGDLILDEPGLTIPHPRMANRRFVLEPLMQIAPEVRHPVEKKTVRSLLETCPDSSKVLVYSSGDLL